MPSFNVNTGFTDGETLNNIRVGVLNPIAVRVTNLMSKTTDLETKTNQAFIAAAPVSGEQKVSFTTSGKPFVLDLTGMFREGSDLAVVDSAGKETANVSKVTFDNAAIIESKIGEVGVSYDWKGLVPANQDWLTIGKSGETSTSKPKGLYFKGKGVQVEATTSTLTTVTIPDVPELIAKVGSDDPKPFDEIQIIGNTAGSTINGTTLQINIPEAGSGGGGITNQNFKGFFSSLGDIESQVTDAISGKSYAFAKDSKLGGNYYTPYFYVNSGWTELKQDPALTYSGPSESQVHGVFSIKPDDRIKVDNNGQVDLSNLGNTEYFVGMFNSQEELNAAVPNPVLDKSFAYVKLNSNGAWVAQYYTHTDKGNAWLKIAPQGTLPLVEFNTDGTTKLIQNFYGVKKGSHLSVDNSGLLVINNPETSSIKVAIKGTSGTEEGAVETLEFAAGKSYATIQDKKLILEHPQRVIQYDSTFESNHNSRDYEGNIYYDETSRCWMGWGVPEASGGVDNKWTKIAHPKMSEEVRDLSKRMPPKAPYISAGVLGDAPNWQHNSWTYVKKDDPQLPEAFKERCGAYFTTVVQDVENDTARPQERLQVCYADEQGGHCYVRTWNKGASAGSSDYGWRPWVKISMSAKDISDHNTDHTSHRDIFKFYKVGTLDMSWATLKAKNWKIADSDLLLLADSDGVSVDGSSTTSVPYTGTYRFSGRIDFDGLNTSSPYPKPNFIVYVYKTVNNVVSIISEHGYRHADHTKPVPPLQWKSGEIQLNEGDKIHFELKDFNNSLDSLTDLRFIPNRTFFVMEDFKTTAGSRIAETFRRTLGSLNSHYNVGVNVHYASGSSGQVRVYGAAVTAQATNMNKVSTKEIT